MIKNKKKVISPRDMSSLLKVRPGVSSRFFNQEKEAKLSLKNKLSTTAKATTRSANLAFCC